ncbi:transcription factor E2F7 [Kryptolebias marmoratus]|uniref:transcription factor E2F7 n=1 Tax=Kryptolebias marmoratus TaxID=37003 RepID=UPI0007F886C6|nr:transcription factor E2F7 [Kryptolebias marmoratus]
MEVECLALKDLTSPRKSFSVEPEEDGGQSDQKENVCVERKRSTPLKPADSTVPAVPAVPVLLANRKGPAPDLTHVTPIKQAALAEPWTPTANLKMLISAASLDIRDREMKKVLFRPMENDKDKPAEDKEADDSSQFEEEDGEKKPSRKQKSLGLLCQKFLALYPDYPPPHSPIWISLDEVATSLGVERRRIYDIVNVLESLSIVGRIAKNSYTWYGRQPLAATLEELQRRGREQGYHLQMELSSDARMAGPGREDDGGEGDAGNAGSNRKDKSLRIMSQKFVMLFLVSKTQTVTLDAAAKVLIEESQDSSSHSKYKTKVRRLYDIANVLTSLSLIKKVHVREEKGRKPAFKWLGPVDFSSSESTAVSPCESESSANNQDFRKTKMARHASFNVAPPSVTVLRQVNSAPSSPRCHLTGQSNQPGEFSQMTVSSSSVFGNSPDHHAEALLVPSPHCLAYLPSLSQPSVVMLYRPPHEQGWTAGGQRSSREERKRRREESEDDAEAVGKKKGKPVFEESGEMGAEPLGQVRCSQVSSAETSSGLPVQQRAAESQSSSKEHAQPSHYLYVPNSAGLNSLNFLIPAGQPPASVALPYVLLPSAAISQYPLLAGSVQQQSSDNPSGLGFSLPAVVSPAHFMLGAAPYSVTAAPEVSGPQLPLPVTPEQSGRYVSAAGTPLSPSGPRQAVSINTQEPVTPHTPKETAAAFSKAFFQTPGTLGGVVAATAARRRGSAQRRLDVEREGNLSRAGSPSAQV